MNGLDFAIAKATGRARCRLCKEMIRKGTLEVIVSGWQTGGHIHRNENTCKRARELAAFEKIVKGDG